MFHICLELPEVLRPLIDSVWYFEGLFEHPQERVVPRGRVQLLVNLHEDQLRWYDDRKSGKPHYLRGAAVSGAHGHPIRIDTAEQRAIVGVTFKPGGSFPFFAAPAHLVRNSHVELADLWGATGASLRERLLELSTPRAKLKTLLEVLTSAAVRPLAATPSVCAAVDALDRGTPVGIVASRLGLSSRKLVRLFHEQVGLTPKRFARVRRVHRALIRLRSGAELRDGAALAVELGYFDQAHMIHDFRALAGVTPGSCVHPAGPGDVPLHF